MPTYDYECRNCGHRFEVIHGMLEDGPAACERCDGPLRRVLFPAGIIFKGSGFYSTDSRPKPATSTESTPSKDTANPSAGSEASGSRSSPSVSSDD